MISMGKERRYLKGKRLKKPTYKIGITERGMNLPDKSDEPIPYISSKASVLSNQNPATPIQISIKKARKMADIRLAIKMIVRMMPGKENGILKTTARITRRGNK